jgi:hypothetical protein
LASTFRAPVSQLYGVEEMGHVAWECARGGGLHVAADCGIFEVLEGDEPVPPGEEGDLVVTSLFGRTMPLIRYRIGDRVAVDPDPCPCGSAFPRFRRIVGRADDLLELPDGRMVHPVVAACGVVDVPGVRRFKITQRRAGSLLVALDTSDELSASLRASIVRHFEEHLGARDVEVRRVGAIPADPSGKLRHIVRESCGGDESPAGAESPVFVVGMPRSGTTLLSALLASHPRISIAPETHYLSLWVRRAPDLVRGFDEFWDAFTSSEQFDSLGVDAGTVRRDLECAGGLDHALVFATLLRAHAAARGKVRWGEKTPTHYLHLDELLRWYPGARVLFVVRDPRAVVASRLRMPWKRRSAADVAAQWRDSIRRLERRTADRRVRTVRYEDVVADTERVLRDICTFLGEEFDEAMLDHEDAARPLVAGQPWSTDVASPVVRSRVLAWEGELKPHDLAVIEHLARAEMGRLGYEAAGRPLGAAGIAMVSVRRALRAGRRRMSGRRHDGI